MTALYKVYVTILAEKLKKKVEEKKIILQNQVGFKKRMGTMNNIYVINYLVNKQLGKGKGITTLFVDLKAAFDSVDRKVLIKAMKGKWIRGSLVESVKEVCGKQ